MYQFEDYLAQKYSSNVVAVWETLTTVLHQTKGFFFSYFIKKKKKDIQLSLPKWESRILCVHSCGEEK